MDNTYSLLISNFEVTASWYMAIGSSILLTMIVGIFTPHITTSINWLICQAISFYDRGFTCNKRNTRQVLQEDYENVYTGQKFLLEFRYAQLVNVTFIVMMFSAGLPLLYPVAFVTFFVTYWFDKMMSKRPSR
jgi:hypothetical protein